MPRAVEHLFGEIREVEAGGAQVRASATFVEVHGETLRDLLVSDEGAAGGEVSGVGIREGKDGVSLVGAVEEDVGCVEDVAGVWARGVARRAVGATGMNAESSRSHAVLCVTVRVDFGDGGRGKVAKLQLVDLAGSERVTRTGLEGEQLKEGIGINKGLLCLGNVIQALSAKPSAARDDSGKEPAPVHVPYRESKLTRLLRDSWGGNSQTVMVACVSPAERDVDDSLSTLRYASRARRITNRVRPNSTGSAAALPPAAVYEELERLRDLVDSLRAAAAQRPPSLDRAPAPEPEPERPAEGKDAVAQTDRDEGGAGANAAVEKMDTAVQATHRPSSRRATRRALSFWLVLGVAAGAGLAGWYLPGPPPPAVQECPVPPPSVELEGASALAAREPAPPGPVDVTPPCPDPSSCAPCAARHDNAAPSPSRGTLHGSAPPQRRAETLARGPTSLLAAYGAASLLHTLLLSRRPAADPLFDAAAFFT